VSDEADRTSVGKLFQSRGPAVANDRSPTVTHRDGRTSRRLEVDERRRPRRLVGRSATYCRSDKYWGAATGQSLNGIQCHNIKQGERLIQSV